MSDTNNAHYIPPPSGPGLKIPILFGIVIALAAANIYMFLQIDQMRTEIGSMQESLLGEVSSLRETSTVTNQTQQRRLETMREELEAARRQAAVAAGQAKKDATGRAEELARELENAIAVEQQRQQKTNQAVKQELTQVANAASVNEASIGEVDTAVKQTQSELEKTIAALTDATGDLGVQSGLIATNAKELSALKELGERNYFEFDIRKTKRPVRVGDIALKLKSTNRKKGKFTLEVVADDKTIEKKERTVNEPLQFYVAAARQPYELVINNVEKNRIVGYLATPKVKIPRKTGPTTASAQTPGE